MPNKPPLPKQACVMGWPVAHSLSPTMHGYWLKKYGIDGVYTAEPVPAVKLQDALQSLIDNGYAGCNLTLPHKEEALALMDMHDESSLVAGAVNTVVVKDGKLKGFDTDGYGFVENLKAQQPNWKKDKAVIIGTGGASRSIIAALRKEGIQKLTLVNRTPERAQKICEAFDIQAEIVPWDYRDSALKDATLLVNSSCLGMTGQQPLTLDLKLLPADATVCDIVYRPLLTPLLVEAQARGNPIVDGLGMLIHQGRLGFSKWFGQDPEVTPELYELMKKAAA